MKKVAFTNHIGRSNHDSNSGKDTTIKTAAELQATEKHNNHDYTQEEVERMQSSISLDDKIYNIQYDRNMNQVEHLDLEAIVKQMYHEEFDEAVKKYNAQQKEKGHAERQIKDYYQYISDNEKQEVVVEGILQFGEYEDWKDLSIDERKKAIPILLEGLKIVQAIPGFKIAGVSEHLNEGSPHIHYVGICVDEKKKKTGLEKRISKSAVFTKKVLSEVMQDQVRKVVEPKIKETFGWELKEKQKGRNEDFTKNQIAIQKQEEQLKELKSQTDSASSGAAAAEESRLAAEEELKKVNEEIEEAKRQLEATNQQHQQILKETSLLERTLSKLKEEYEKLVERVKGLVEAIHPLERVISILNTISAFEGDFRTILNVIKRDNDLTSEEENELADFVDYLDGGYYGVDEAIDIARELQETPSDDNLIDFDVDDPER